MDVHTRISKIFLIFFFVKSYRTPSSLTQNFTQLADILKQPVKTQNISTSSPAFIKFSMPSSSLATTMSSSSNTTIPTQSKISVVSPTILMPPQMTAKSTDLQQRQVCLPSNLHALLAAPGARTTVTNANGMKFLLVNAADQRGSGINTSNLAATLPLTGNSLANGVTNQANVTIIQNPTTQMQVKNQHQQQQQQQQLQQKQQQHQQHQKQQQNSQQNSSSKAKETLKRTDIRQEYKEQLKKRDLLGKRSIDIRLKL